jgi:hypothetical protein
LNKNMRPAVQVSRERETKLLWMHGFNEGRHSSRNVA